MRRKYVKIFNRGEGLNCTHVLILYLARIFGKHVLHCNGIDPLVMLNLGFFSIFGKGPFGLGILLVFSNKFGK